MIPSPSGPAGRIGLLIVSFMMLLIGAEIFTNGVEWLGHRLGVSESATGSILAAVGTALPETMIPTIAILQAQFGGGSQAAANEVGVGAILGAPFMLGTIAMFMVGSSVLIFRNRRNFGAQMHFNHESTRRDLSFFMVGYTLAFIAALIPNETIATGIGLFLVLLYITYVYKSVTSGELIEDEGLEELHLGEVLESVVDPMPLVENNRGYANNPSTPLVILQALFALGIIIGGAHVFVAEVQWVSSEILHIPAAVVAIILAPLATELPEKFNSVIWISRDKDTLALGNITGAMAFQGTLPVTLGILFTSWNLTLQWGTSGFLNAFSAILALVGGGIVYLRARNVGEANMNPRPFLIGGVFYALFLIVVVYHVFTYDLAISGGH